jgi:hypothetical protein
MKHTYLTLALLVLLGGRAGADPCAMVDKDQATWAVKYITGSPQIVTWGEQAASPPARPPETKAVANKTGAWQVLVGGKGIDLATVYVQTGPKTFTNVARLVGCAGTSAAFVDLPSCPAVPPPGTCAKGKPVATRDAITGCVRSYACP